MGHRSDSQFLPKVIASPQYLCFVVEMILEPGLMAAYLTRRQA
jgi:hypothetical protein